MALVVIKQLGIDACVVIVDVCYAFFLTNICVKELCQIVADTVLSSHQSIHRIIEVMNVVFSLLKGPHQLTLGIVFKLLFVPLDHKTIRIENKLLLVCTLYLVVLVDSQQLTLTMLGDFNNVVVSIVLILPYRLSVEDNFHDVVVYIVDIFVCLQVARPNFPTPLVNSAQIIILHLQSENHIIVEPKT